MTIQSTISQAPAPSRRGFFLGAAAAGVGAAALTTLHTAPVAEAVAVLPAAPVGGGGYSLSAALLMEVVQTALFIFVIARVTRRDGAGNMAPVAIGLTLAAMHIMSIPVANTSLNPARSIATAVIEQGWALQQLWLFIVAPLVGGFIGGAVDKALGDN